MTARHLRIGEVAARTGVSARTLRYYEELGLLSPAGKTAGGARRYGDEDIARLLRIRQLQELMGFDLVEIASVLQAEDRLGDLRQKWLEHDEAGERAAVLAEASEINDRVQAQVRAKLERLQEFLAELDAKKVRYAELSEELKGRAATP